ncbi:MAG TPA: DUF2235 domain-containing protein [Marmoricola sp.]|nr:DUF2235 domain-containing protein [Marmoricola sp.]
MVKRLVMCCDGTWNTPDEVKDGLPCPTNVVKLALAVADRGEDGVEQRVFYHPGVGTKRSERVRGGAFGYGLSRNVRETYRFVVENYEPGDELFFFGFSRGAFTARSAVGLVRNSGILQRAHLDRLDQAYALYRSRAAHPRGVEATLFRRSWSWESRIRCIGVWDTVGALGIPLGGPLAGLVNKRWAFHDTQLSSHVDNAFQALAIDEQRRPFVATLWQPSDAPAPGQRVEQVWFSGVHSDVGGGYADAALADVALLWMADRARSCGLGFVEDAFDDCVTSHQGPAGAEIAVRPDPAGPLHESRTGYYRLLPPLHRQIGKTDPAQEYAASSAVLRLEKDDGYAPDNLRAYLAGRHQVCDLSAGRRPVT